MKVGILTFPNSTSYGATLQMYALYKKVNDLGHEAEIINYHNAFMKADKHCSHKDGKFDLRRFMRHYSKKILHARFVKAFREFEKENMILYPDKSFVDKNRLLELGKRYDAIICGSDQVWNPNITDSDLSYFLGFCSEGTKRISYAPSFGISDFSPEFSDMIREDIRKFDSLSIREKTGCEYIIRAFGREPKIVCDPTMLLDAIEWEQLEKTYSASENGYILYYTISSSKALLKFAKWLSEKTGFKIIVVGGNFLKKLKNNDKNIDYAIDISVGEWLWLVHHARYVVTNSFHGTAFSIIYRKDFYVNFSSATNSRLEQITTMLGLESRVVDGATITNLENCNYDYSETVLPCLCEDSLKYLDNALRKEEK